MSYAERARALDTPEFSEESGFYRLVGAAVQKVRLRRGMKQIELARSLGLSQSGLARFESGETRFPLYELVRTAALLKVPLGAIIPKGEDS